MFYCLQEVKNQNPGTAASLGPKKALVSSVLDVVPLCALIQSTQTTMGNSSAVY